MQRITLGLSEVFCILSIAGAVHAVQQLMEQLQLVGWICLAGALLLFGPVAFYVYGYIHSDATLLQRSNQYTRE